MKILFVALTVLLLNIPFGYWRANVQKYSLKWFLAVHIPVPVIIAFRIFSELGWEFYTFPILISVFFLGQFVGGKILEQRKRACKIPLMSCLIWDIVIEVSKNKK